MRLACTIFARNLSSAASSSAGGIIVITIFDVFLRRIMFLLFILCSSQNAMSEFAALCKIFRLHLSLCIGTIRARSDSVMCASIQTQTLASAFSLSRLMLYWSLRSLYRTMFLCLRHALPHCDYIRIKNRKGNAYFVIFSYF